MNDTPPVNNAALLKNNDYIKLVKVLRHLDRIQLNIEWRGWFYTDIHYIFDSVFSFRRISCKEGRQIRHYSFNGIRFELVRYYGNSFYFAISMSNPNQEIQEIISDVLREIVYSPSPYSFHQPSVYLCQVEFAVDVYPERLSDLPDLGNSLIHGLVLRYSRMESYKLYITTHYQGLRGDVRKGSRGLTGYAKPIKNPQKYRIELRCNYAFLKRHRINLNSLPLLPDTIDLFDFVDFRRGLNDQSIRKLANSSLKKWEKSRNKNHIKKASSMHRNSILDSVRGTVTRKIVVEDFFLSEISDATTIPVAAQLDIFKELKNRYGFTNQINQFFPKVEKDKFLTDLLDNRIVWRL